MAAKKTSHGLYRQNLYSYTHKLNDKDEEEEEKKKEKKTQGQEDAQSCPVGRFGTLVL